MTAGNNNLLELYMFSPLDQFDDDECSVGLLDNMLTDLIPGMGYVEDLLDFTGANEIDSTGDWTTIALTTALTIALITSSTMLFDYEDAGDSEWEEGDMTTSGMQASIFSAGLGVETTVHGVSLAFLFSVSTIVTFILIGFFIRSVRYLFMPYLKQSYTGLPDQLITLSLKINIFTSAVVHYNYHQNSIYV